MKKQDASKANQDTGMPTENAEENRQQNKVAERKPLIRTRQSLFDKHLSESVSANINCMQQVRLSLPDRYLTDFEGLLGIAMKTAGTHVFVLSTHLYHVPGLSEPHDFQATLQDTVRTKGRLGRLCRLYDSSADAAFMEQGNRRVQQPRERKVTVWSL
jgi:hypothetical protein